MDVQVKMKSKHSRLPPEVLVRWNWKQISAKAKIALCDRPLKVLNSSYKVVLGYVEAFQSV